MQIVVLRTHYTDTETAGIMLLDGLMFGYTLEDKMRIGPKVKGATAIPAGLYRLVLSRSARFGRLMPEVLKVPGFEGIRIHGGNSHKDTEGCILVAQQRVNVGRIFTSLEARLTDRLTKAGGNHSIEVIDTHTMLFI